MNEQERIWYCIRGYNGYEYSNDGLLRSMKNYKKNPYGKLIKKYKDKVGYYFILSNDLNVREKVYESKIKDIVKNDKILIKRGTYDTDISSRNKFAPSAKKRNDGYIGIPRFTIIDNEKKKVNPIYFY